MAVLQGIDYGMEELKEAMAQLYDTKEDADLEIVCGGTKLKVHSLLLWPRCKFFAAACKCGFKEAGSKIIELPDDKPHMVWRMIKYFYLGDYPDSGPALEIGPEEYVSSMNINAELYALGDKYDIKGLKKLSSKKFEAALDRIRGGALEFCAAIPLVYTTTPDTDRTLRDLVFRAVSRNWKLLSAAPNFKDCMLRNPGFVIDVVNKMCQSPLLGPCKRCKSEDLWKVDHVKCSCGWGESV